MSDMQATIRLAHRLPRISRRFERVHSDDLLIIAARVVRYMELMQTYVELGEPGIVLAAAVAIDNKLGRVERLTEARARYKDTGDILGLLSTYRAFIYGNR